MGPVRLLAALLLALPTVLLAQAGAPALPKPPKLARPPSIHVVTLGPVRAVPYTPPDAAPDERREDTTTLHIRPLVVDERQREWVTGEIHEVTDRPLQPLPTTMAPEPWPACSTFHVILANSMGERESRLKS